MKSCGLLQPAVAAANAAAAEDELDRLVDIRDEVTTTPAVADIELNWNCEALRVLGDGGHGGSAEEGIDIENINVIYYVFYD